MTEFGEVGRAAGGGAKFRVAFAALPARKEFNFVAVYDVGEDAARFEVFNESAGRDFYGDVRARVTRHVFEVAGETVAGAELFGVFEVDEGVKGGVGFDVDVAAVAAVAAVGAAVLNELFAVKRGSAVAAVAAFAVNCRFIYKHSLKPQNMRRYSRSTSKSNDYNVIIPLIRNVRKR